MDHSAFVHVPAPELEGWKRAFLDAGMRGLKRHVEPEAASSVQKELF
jgi:hypothetical protein